VSGWFDLERNMDPFYSLLRHDVRLFYMADAFAGLRIVGIPNLFEALCWSITGQQINLTFAYKLKRRLVETYGTHLELNNGVFHMFPSCGVIAEADPDDLRKMQFSTKKAEYIIGVAKSFVAGTLSEEILTALPDLTSRQKMLMSMKGIGIWTANYALMKCLKEQSGVPYGDSGLMQALLSHNIISDKKDVSSIHDFFRGLQGWESYMVFYLWRSLAKK
jgi:DNA-3-methyladenine glycosylase II